MKWTNVGHEFDAIYEEIRKKKKFYLYGAGDYGRQFYQLIHEEIQIGGFIDSDEKKQKSGYHGLPCFALLNSQRWNKTDGIILTISQVLRDSGKRDLENAGYILNKDYFIIEDFLMIYYVYKYNKVYFSSISFLPSTACNLNCKLCLNFNPYAEKKFVRPLNQLKRDIDLFFNCIDHIMLFHVSGGEPLLYKDIGDVIVYIHDNYMHRIDTLRMVTNGTVVPSDELLCKMKKSEIELTVDDYRESVPEYNDNFTKLIEKLDEFGVNYYINKALGWINLAPMETDYSNLSEEALRKHFDDCCQSWQELRDGKIFCCNYASYAVVAGLIEDKEEFFDLREFNEYKKKELVEFRLRYTRKGYTNFCKRCRGFKNSNPVTEIPAIQMEK